MFVKKSVGFASVSLRFFIKSYHGLKIRQISNKSELLEIEDITKVLSEKNDTNGTKSTGFMPNFQRKICQTDECFWQNRRVKFDKHTCEFLKTHASCSQEERFRWGKLPFLSGLKRR